VPINPRDLSEVEQSIFTTLNSAQQEIYLDLSPAVRGLVGRWAPTGACVNAQQEAGACAPDPRVTSQVGVRIPIDLNQLSADKMFQDRVQPYRLKGARKGHLLLTPGGPSGLIGALLSALVPAQDYSHMGIIVDDDGLDGTAVRHCTTSEDWLNSGLFQTGKVFDGTPLELAIPEDGFRSDAVKFLWPGTITQTVENAFKAAKAETLYRQDVFELDAKGEIVTVNDENGEPQNVLREPFATVDGGRDFRATGKSFLIHALSFDPVIVNKADALPEYVADALIVQPCIRRESARVRDALKRVAEASLELRGHYRFFAYTDCRVGAWKMDPQLSRGTPHRSAAWINGSQNR
jgi:hypothetical protein